MVFLCKNGRRSDDIWEKVKEGGGKKISGFMKPKKKKMEQLKRMDEIQRLAESDKASEFIFTDSDGNVIVPDGNETLEFMHLNYKG